jgi:hypothetical protein
VTALRIGTDAIRRDSVIAGEHEHRRRAQHRRFGLQHRAELDRERFERAERALRLGASVEPALQRSPWLSCPSWKNPVSPYHERWGAHNA